MLNDSYYLNRNEIALLLNSFNVNELNCLDVFSNETVMDNNSAYLSLFEMVKSGMVDVEGTSFVADKDINRIFDMMLHNEKHMEIYFSSEQKPNTMIYKSGNEYVITQQDIKRNDCLKLSRADGLGVLEYINEYADLKNEQNDTDSNEMILSSLSLMTLEDDFSEMALNSKSVAIYYQIMSSSISKALFKAVVINESEGFRLIIWENEVKSVMFEKEKLSDFVKKYFTEEIL